MYFRKKIKLLLSILFIYFSCSNSSKKKLDKALELSKGNRTELEHVLNHYSLNESDSLKYKAAVFLIENMPLHSYESIDVRFN